MVRKNITYVDFDGQERTDAFYFNLSEAELMDIELDYGGNMSAAMNTMLERHDVKGVLGVIAKMIRKAYGEKTADGKRFMKNQELTDSFVTTEAYSTLLIELLNDENELEKFMAAVMPSKMREEVEKKLEERRANTAKEEAGAESGLKVVGDPVMK